MTTTNLPTVEAVTAALATVQDPEIHRPITDLGMVADVRIDAAGRVEVDILLTTAGCPLRDRITSDVTGAVKPLDGVTDVGLSSGASVPEILVHDVIAWLAARGYADLEEVEHTEERLTFALPQELRRDMRLAAKR